MTHSVEDCVSYCVSHGIRNLILALPFPVTNTDVAHFLERPDISGIVVPDFAATTIGEADGDVGYFVSDGNGWVLPRRKARTIAYVGPGYTLRFHMARAALFHGAVWFVYSRRLTWHRELIALFLVRRVFEKIYYVVTRFFAPLGPPLWDRLGMLAVGPSVLRVWDKVVSSLRVRRFRRTLIAPDLPLLPREAFVRGRVILANSSLAYGGAERQIVNTIFGIAKHGIKDVTLLCENIYNGSDHDFYLSHFDAGHVEIVEIRDLESGAWSGALEGFADRLIKHVRHLPPYLADEVLYYACAFIQQRPEVVHAWQDATNIKAGIAAALVGVPRIVLSTRNMAPIHFTHYLAYIWPGYRALERFSNVVVVNNSRAGVSDYARWLRLPAERFQILCNGLDSSRLCRAMSKEAMAYRTQVGIPEDAVVVGSIFRFDKEKDPLLWVRTIARVARTRSDVAFLLIGTGPMADSIRRLARSLGIADRLFMPGTEKNPTLPLSVMDVFLLTSKFEGTPNVVLEAQWLGVPVVATDAGGTRDAIDVGRSGWIAEKRNPDALAERVLFVFANKDWCAQVRHAGPEFVASRFGLDRMIRETLDIYGY